MVKMFFGLVWIALLSVVAVLFLAVWLPIYTLYVYDGDIEESLRERLKSDVVFLWVTVAACITGAVVEASSAWWVLLPLFYLGMIVPAWISFTKEDEPIPST
jgi:hypothetical protein